MYLCSMFIVYSHVCLSFSFFVYCSVSISYSDSFPTRRSSDLTRSIVDGHQSRLAATADEDVRRHHERRRSADALLRVARSEEHTSALQSPCNLVCRLLLQKKKQGHTPSLTRTAPPDTTTP